MAFALGAGVVDLFQVLLGGLATGSLYALLLLGILVVFQVSKNVNFAYGPTGMVAAFGSWYLYAVIGIPAIAAVAIGLVGSGVVATLTGYLIVRRIPEGRGLDVIVTLGILLFLTAAAQVAFGVETHTYLPEISKYSVTIGGVFINLIDVLAIVLGFIAVIGGHLVLNRTNLGLSFRAAAESEAIARGVGLNVVGLRTGVWAASGVLAGVGGIMFASRLSVDAYFMTPIIINVFICGMVGGLDRYWPPMAAAFGIAIYQSLSVYIFGPDAGTPALFILVIALISLAPKRFVEERYEARA